MRDAPLQLYEGLPQHHHLRREARCRASTGHRPRAPICHSLSASEHPQWLGTGRKRALICSLYTPWDLHILPKHQQSARSSPRESHIVYSCISDTMQKQKVASYAGQHSKGCNPCKSCCGRVLQLCSPWGFSVNQTSNAAARGPETK